jgi:hypothetical protein
MTFIDDKDCEKIYRWTVPFRNIGNTLYKTIEFYVTRQLMLFRSCNRILFDRKSFPFLLEENIIIKSSDFCFEIEPTLTIEKFKELVNLKEKCIVFKNK